MGWKMYNLTVSKTLAKRYGFFRHLILNGFYIRLGKLVIAIWEN